MEQEEGHYAIKRVKVLPKKGNANYLYVLNTSPITNFFRPNQLGYEKLNVYLDGRIVVTQDNVKETLGGKIDSNKEYFIDGVIDVSDISIEVPFSGIGITGYGFDISKLYSSKVNHKLFVSPSKGSGNVFLADITIEIVGINSSVYNLKSYSGNEAKEVNNVNYNSCTSLGYLDNYRQILERNTGRFGGTPELELKGIMNGLRVTTSIVRGLSGITSLFKAGEGLVFSGRVITDINCDLPSNGALFDFSESNFLNDESFIINGSFVTRLGQASSADTTVHPNIDETSVKSLWKSNTGISNTTKYLKGAISNEVETIISAPDTYYTLAGTWNIEELSHFDMPVNGEFRLLSGNGSYKIHADLVIVGTANDVIDIRITESNDGRVTFPTVINHIKRQINSLAGIRDVAFFPISFIKNLHKNDRIRIEVENRTSSDNVTAELDSYIIVND